MLDEDRKGVCLDTSFLITLCSSKRTNHSVARRYFEFWLSHDVPLFLPSVCYAEFLAREKEVPAYILNRVHLLAFDPESAIIAGAIQRTGLSVLVEDTPRVAVKDDIKIIANACQNNVLGIVTEDENSMARYIRRAAETIAAASGLKPLLLSSGFNEGDALFRPPELQLDYEQPPNGE